MYYDDPRRTQLDDDILQGTIHLFAHANALKTVAVALQYCNRDTRDNTKTFELRYMTEEDGSQKLVCTDGSEECPSLKEIFGENWAADVVKFGSFASQGRERVRNDEILRHERTTR